MIEKIGIGIDIVDIKRFEKLPYLSNITFYKKIFDANEIKYCMKFNNPFPHFAAMFAVKEATIKAVKKPISINDIKIVHSNNKPQVSIKGSYNKKYKFILSVSHEKKIAVAVVISETLKL